MRKLIAIVLGLAVVAGAFAAVWHFAEGRGAIALGDHGPGRFAFRVAQEGPHIRGELRFQAGRPEDPLVTIGLPAVQHAEWTRHGVRFSGRGAIERGGERVPCMVFAYAIDLEGAHDDPDHPDRFGIRAVGHNGHVLFEAEGPVRHGDIVVRHGGQ